MKIYDEIKHLKKEYLYEKYNWERDNLCHKFLLNCDYYNEKHIPERNNR